VEIPARLVSSIVNLLYTVCCPAYAVLSRLRFAVLYGMSAAALRFRFRSQLNQVGTVRRRAECRSLVFKHDEWVADTGRRWTRSRSDVGQAATRGLPTRGLNISQRSTCYFNCMIRVCGHNRITSVMFQYARKKTSISSKKTKTKHAKSPVASASCPVTLYVLRNATIIDNNHNNACSVCRNLGNLE